MSKESLYLAFKQSFDNELQVVRTELLKFITCLVANQDEEKFDPATVKLLCEFGVKFYWFCEDLKPPAA